MGAIDFFSYIYKLFGMEFSLVLSTRPKKAIGEKALWDKAEKALAEALDEGIGKGKWGLNKGDGAFYGPKIDFHVTDSLERSWQCGTIQCDFFMPGASALDCTYVGADGAHHVPVMIHRAIFGSIERFFGILIEHYAGAFPTWLAPEQVRVLSITDAQGGYAQQIDDALKAAGIRSEVDLRNEKIGFKIREAETQKIPLSLVVGEQEAEARTVSPRLRKSKDKIDAMALDALTAQLATASAERSMGPPF